MRMKQLMQLIYVLIVVALVAIAAVVLFSSINAPYGIRFYTVQSGSMMPAIQTGSVILVKPDHTYEVGDVITYKNAEDRFLSRPSFTTTHRIVSIEQAGSTINYETKGDANNAADSLLVEPELVIGKVSFHIPFIGYPVSFARTQAGFIALIIIPATMIIYSEFLALKKEIMRQIKLRPKVQDE